MSKTQEHSVSVIVDKQWAFAIKNPKSHFILAPHKVKIEKLSNGDFKVSSHNDGVLELFLDDLTKFGEHPREYKKMLNTMDPPYSDSYNKLSKKKHSARSPVPSAPKFTMLVNKSYEFIIDDVGIMNGEIKKLRSGNFKVIGTKEALQNFANDITIDDYESSKEMLDTLKPVISESNRHMKLRQSQLRSIIKEELTKSAALKEAPRPRSNQRIGTLHDLQAFDKEAFNVFVQDMIDDSTIQFTAGGDGRISARSSDNNISLRWDPETGKAWMPQGSR
jgi:hypothetical protein